MANKKKTVGDKIDAKIEAVARVDDIVIQEINEPIGTITFKRWQVASAAAAVTVLLLVVLF